MGDTNNQRDSVVGADDDLFAWSGRTRGPFCPQLLKKKEVPSATSTKLVKRRVVFAWYGFASTRLFRIFMVLITSIMETT